MRIEEFTSLDLERIRSLQPEGWPDIQEAFRQYLSYSFCMPVKVALENRIIGLGCIIYFRNTAWLAHIIVDLEFRGRGIGSAIVDFLLYKVKAREISKVLLIATDLGEPIYRRAGFRQVSDYVFFEREHPWRERPFTPNVRPYREKYESQLLELDRKISGEDRADLIRKHLEGGFVSAEHDSIKGYYLPALGEGIIVSTTPEAGRALMAIKYTSINRAVLPAENRYGIEFLLQNGFIQTFTKGRRMIYGDDVEWHPECYYSRIGGNFG